jgi:hypothetical protein
MHPERTYKTESGTYSESDLALLVWLNPDFETKKQSRLLMTMTDYSSIHPMAFPINLLRTNQIFARCPLADLENISDLIFASSAEHPVIIPLSLARSKLGWEEFFVPTKYVEPGQK